MKLVYKLSLTFWLIIVKKYIDVKCMTPVNS